jgi:hypothetical protein
MVLEAESSKDVEQADIAQETSFQKGDSLGIYP